MVFRPYSVGHIGGVVASLKIKSKVYGNVIYALANGSLDIGPKHHCSKHGTNAIECQQLL